MANIADLQIEIENSINGRVRITAGTGEEQDTGIARLVTTDEPCGIIEYGNICVAWDSGVITTLARDENSIEIN